MTTDNDERVTDLKRRPVYGPEAWLTVGETTWCHWDKWFALVACDVLDAT